MTQPKLEPLSEEAYRQCAHAEQLLADPLFDEVFAIVEAVYIDEWKVCDDLDRRETAWHLVQGLHDVHKGFRKLADRKVAHDLQHKAEDE
jgi:hypothetical protein